MKIVIQLVVFIFLFNSTFIIANEHDHAHHHKDISDQKHVQGTQGAICENIIDVQVNGLVCDFCARALEKVIGKRKDVSGIDVDLNNGKVSIAMKEGKNIDDATLTKLITDSGYNTVAIKRGC